MQTRMNGLHLNVPIQSNPICVGIAVRMKGMPRRLLHIYVFHLLILFLCVPPTQQTLAAFATQLPVRRACKNKMQN